MKYINYKRITTINVLKVSRFTQFRDTYFTLILQYQKWNGPIFNQCSTSVPPENIRKPTIF